MITFLSAGYRIAKLFNVFCDTWQIFSCVLSVYNINIAIWNYREHSLKKRGLAKKESQKEYAKTYLYFFFLAKRVPIALAFFLRDGAAVSTENKREQIRN